MPQPSLSGSPLTVTFGGLAQPNGQGVLSNINLNDVTSWFVQDLQLEHGNRIIGTAQQVTRIKAVYISDDFGEKVVNIPMRYSEAVNPLGTGLAQLSQAGEQRLSFDGSTFILAKYQGITNRRLIRKFAPYLWEFTLQFRCREPWYKDISATTSSTTTLASAPTAVPTASATSGGSLTTGTYTLAYTYVWSGGETAPSPSTTAAPSFPVQDSIGAVRISPATVKGMSTSAAIGPTRSIKYRMRHNPGPRMAVASSAVTLSGSNLQISVGAVTFPSWATGVKWYFTGSSPTTGFTVQNANGNAFTLNTAGNGVGPPTSTPATSFSITYPGSVWCEPVFTVTIPSSNPNSVVSLVLTNTMSSEQLTITPPGTLLGGRAVTLTIDSGAWTVVDGSGNSYDYTGSFQMLYGPVNQANTLTAQLTGSPADPSGVTVAASWNNRWEA